jgi:NADH:ubiquinone oxidoreductase subunit F (NADH-binding)
MTATPRTLARRGGAVRLLAGVGESPAWERHTATFGALPGARELIETVEAAGLRGRGGAAFPTAAKLAVVAAARHRPVVVVNAVEGEPASKKDRSLLRVAPHLVLDGAVLAAAATGADEIVIGLPARLAELDRAIAERGRDRRAVAIRTARTPAGYVTGEETALLRALADKPAKPASKPPYPFERGLRGRPTLVLNVETLAHVALIARAGAEAYGDGTALVTLGGAVARPGVHEIPLGTTLGEALRACGGCSSDIAGILLGGYFGRWVAPAEAASLQLTADIVGAGVIVALPASTCAAGEVARVARYLASQSARQCGPCTHGLAAVADALDPGARGDRRAEVGRLTALVAGRGACRHPDGAARFVESALEVFATEFARHAGHRGCGRRDEHVLPVPERRG